VPFAVELFFDPELEKSLKQVWAEVSAAAGAPNTMAEQGHRPHLTLAFFEGGPIENILTGIQIFAGKQRPFEVCLDSVGTFPGPEGVVFLAPIPTQTLLSAHSNLLGWIHGLAEGLGLHYSPGKLVFHCTMNIGLNEEQLPRVMAAARMTPLPLNGRVETVALLRLPENVVLGEFKLRGRN
jgi:2'-5' RNA ligase